MKKTVITLAALSLSALAMAEPKAAVTPEAAASEPVASISAPEVIETAPVATPATAPVFIDAEKAKTADGRQEMKQDNASDVLEGK